ncbi:MAG: hypothetical protein HYY30_04735 [Chloroflexi bacterium]|nr:hypothetical protein [Chloroflexota bacterium]
MAREQEYPAQEQYPTIASSENFEIWDDVEDGVYIISFNLNGATIAIDHETFEEFASVIAEASKFHKSQSNGRR